MCRMWSRNLVNEEALTQWALSRQKQTKKKTYISSAQVPGTRSVGILNCVLWRVVFVTFSLFISCPHSVDYNFKVTCRFMEHLWTTALQFFANIYRLSATSLSNVNSKQTAICNKQHMAAWWWKHVLLYIFFCWLVVLTARRTEWKQTLGERDFKHISPSKTVQVA